MARKTGGQVNDVTGRVERGRMPKGSLEDVVTIKEGPLSRLLNRKGGKR
jgi:translation elongation factor EF-Tu-like GTPase